MPAILIPGGGRIGHGKMAGEDAFRTKLAEGFEVYTTLNDVYFAVTVRDAETMNYVPLPGRPPGV